MLLSDEEYLFFTDRALDGMTGILRELGDELAGTRPDLPGANSPYAIVTHCLGVMEYWAGHLVAGRDVHRDRDAEFTATGAVSDLVARVENARKQLRADLAVAESTAPLRDDPPSAYLGIAPGTSQAAALQHVYEELAQHHGQLELTRDVLLARHARFS